MGAGAGERGKVHKDPTELEFLTQQTAYVKQAEL